MRFLSRSLFSISLLAALSVSANVASAQSGRGGQRERPQEAPQRQEEPRAAPREQRSSSLSDAVRRVQRETGGQVLGAERVQFDGRDINRVKVMDDRGRVRYMDDDPQRNRESSERRRMDTPRPREQGEPRPRGDNPRRP